MKIFDLKKNPIGANITMQDIKTKNIYNNYVSFGKYINNENDLKSYVNGVFTEDFKLLSYELYYTNNNWQKIKNIIKQYRSN